MQSTLVRGLHRAWPATGDHGIACLDHGSSHLDAQGVHRVIGLGARGAKDADGRAEFGKRAETLHELTGDPHDPPGVGVHPVAGLTPVEQSLVRGLGGHP